MKNILKSNIKLLYAIVVLSVTLLSLSYGIFVITSSDYKASELMVGNLLYGITIHDTDKVMQSNPVTVSEGETVVYITISSVNSIASKYTLAYNNNNVTVSASNKSGWNASGAMTNYNNYAYSKTVKVVVTNNSGSSQSVTFAAFGGYLYNSTSNIPLGSGWYSVANFSDVTSTSGKLLTTIVEEDTNCNSANCLYGGEATTNYFSFEEDGDLYRILGIYTIDNDKVTKIAANTLTEVTTSSNLSASLNTIKSSLNTDNIYSTNKFNCHGTNSISCSSSNYNDVGILSLDEYKNIEGDNESSYLYNSNEYYLLNGNNLVTNTNQSEEVTSAKVRPAMYLEDSVEVTGSGTVDDPYVLENGEVNIIAYYLDNADVTNTITYSTLYNGNYEIDKVLCSKGEAEVKNNSYITFASLPAKCSIYFKTGTGIDIAKTMASLSNGPRTNMDNLGDPDGVYDSIYTNDGSKVYYYSGSPSVNNWVIFGKCTTDMAATYNCIENDYLYWRIIRTNTDEEGGGIRLLYSASGMSGSTIVERNAGVSCASDGTGCPGKPYVGKTVFNSISNCNIGDATSSGLVSPLCSRYAFGSHDTTLDDLKTNENDSTVKTYLDNWLKTTTIDFRNKLNYNAIYCINTYTSSYCNDCSGFWDGPYNSLACDNSSWNSFSLKLNPVPNGDKLKGVGVALLSYGEVKHCGHGSGSWIEYVSDTTQPYNALGAFNWFWLIDPFGRSITSGGTGIAVFDWRSSAHIDHQWVYYSALARPVVSLTSDVYAQLGGTGSTSKPYIISTD